MSKLIPVLKSKYRSIVCEMLPYEKPLFFSNRFFARFLKRYCIVAKDGELVSEKYKDNEGLNLLLKLLGGSKDSNRKCFQYYISKENNEKGRCLSVIHPYHQVQMMEFYDKYKLLLVHFCSKSNFSIRFPYKVATFQKSHKGFFSTLSDSRSNEQKTGIIKHFFAYKYYTNINEFYDDYRFIRAEKRFSTLCKIDLKKCFESINPESISNAMFESELSECRGTMAEVFCNLQKSFLSEESGLVIGPEFSRIYAEIILQKIDVLLEQKLKEKHNYIRNKDYQFFRYVDDGFLFSKDTKISEAIIIEYNYILKEYNLKINTQKCVKFFDKPFINNVSSVKQEITKLVDSVFESRLDTFKGFLKAQKYDFDTPTKIKYLLFVKSLRTIIGSSNSNKKNETAVQYNEVMSFTLGLIYSHLETLLKRFDDLYKVYSESELYKADNEDKGPIYSKYRKEFIEFVENLIEIMFYLLSCDLRMATSMKIVSILTKLQQFVRGCYKFDDGNISMIYSKYYIERIDEKISHETQSFLENVILNENNIMEVLNILELQKKMCKKNQISESTLRKCIYSDDTLSIKLNYFVVFELIHFISFSSKYEWLTKELYRWIDKTLERLLIPCNSDTEATLTMFELLCCPWIDENIKIKWSRKIFNNKYNDVMEFSSNQKDIFIKWTNYKVFEETQHIDCAEVY